MDNVTKTRVDAAKTAAERVVQKIAETTVDLIGNKIVIKTTSAVKAKSKEKKDETNFIIYHHINLYTTRKKQQIADDLRYI